MWVYNGLNSVSYTVCSRRFRNCLNATPESFDAVGLTSLSPTDKISGLIIVGHTVVATEMLASTNSSDYFNVNSQCKVFSTPRIEQNSFYTEIRSALFTQFSGAPNLLLDSNSVVTLLVPKSSAYYLMKFQGCSGTSCEVINPRIDSVADNILFGNSTWAGPVDSSYPANGIIVFAVSSSLEIK